ncbi:hypothetical protein DUI87_07369 [Hirundo rustica rustica]|uniref:Uncharacterized protein n=1 Tax=Hirundo rustica rustica TaxID=333673 RepID=A0A3M0L7K1_HIRRU|nr:hypothetical protein DUI87_07369 [Hirundo rustica rustica]
MRRRYPSNHSVGEDETEKPYKYDCLAKDSKSIKPISEIEMKASFEIGTNHKWGEADFSDTCLSLDALPGTFQTPGKGLRVTDRVPKKRERGLTGTGQTRERMRESIREDDLIAQETENLLGMWVCDFQIHELTFAKQERHGWIFTPVCLPETLLRKDIDVLKHVQRRAMELLKDLERKSYEEQLWEPGAFNLEESQGTLIIHFNYLKRGCCEEGRQSLLPDKKRQDNRT